MNGGPLWGELRVALDPAQGVDVDSLGAAVELQAHQLTGLRWRTERLFPDPEGGSLLLRSDPIDLHSEHAQALGLRVRREISAREDVSQAAIDLPVDAFDPDDVGAFSGTHDRPPATEDPNWSHRLLHVEDAWTYSLTNGRPVRGSGILIGHPDTGYTDHPNLARALAAELGFDTVSNERDARDPLERGFGLNPGHGTSTASKIVGGAGDGTVLLGVAPDARVVPLRAIRGVVQVFDSDVARAVDHARRRNVHIISMSLGGKGFFGLRRAIQRAVDAGIIVCAAAGNNVKFVVAPASYADTIAVGGTDFQDRPWEGSSRGDRVDVSAPAEAVHVAAFDWTYEDAPGRVVRRSDGTSFAVAQVAGAAALWLAHHGRGALIERYGASQLVAAFRALLQGAAVRRPDGWEDGYGSGVIDALALLQADLPDPGELDTVGAFAARDSAAERIASILGDVRAEDVVARATELSGLADRSAVLGWLARNEDELVYLLMTDDAVEQRLRGTAGAFWTQPERLATATEGVRSAFGTPEATYVAAAATVRSTGADASVAAFVRERPFDRQEVDLAVLEDDFGQLSAHEVVNRVEPNGTRWSMASDTVAAVVIGQIDVDAAGAFGGDPLDDLANALLEPSGELVQSRRVARRSLEGGRQEVRHLTMRGHEVVGSDFRLSLASDGRTQISGRVLDIARDMDPGPPPPPRADDIDLVCRDHLGLPATVTLDKELVLFPTPDELVWAYKLKGLVEEPLADLRIYLRADDLRLMLSHDLVLAHPEADIYESNPLRNASTTRVLLTALADGATTLTSAAFDVSRRRGNRLTSDSGSFLVATDDAEFDEPNVFHHLTRGLQWFRDLLGRDPLDVNDYRPVRALTRDAGSRTARGQYVPSDHTLRFDDRRNTAARSADIVYHELTHAVTDAECRLYRSPSTSAKGIAEGLADYVASAILDDPRFGDYVMNDVDGYRNCNDPDRRLRFAAADGDSEHAIGAVWAAMLWDLRRSLGGDVVDPVAAGSLRHLVPGSSLDHGVEALVTEDGTRNGGGAAVGPNEAAIRQAYTDRV